MPAPIRDDPERRQYGNRAVRDGAGPGSQHIVVEALLERHGGVEDEVPGANADGRVGVFLLVGRPEARLDRRQAATVVVGLFGRFACLDRVHRLLDAGLGGCRGRIEVGGGDDRDGPAGCRYDGRWSCNRRLCRFFGRLDDLIGHAVGTEVGVAGLGEIGIGRLGAGLCRRFEGRVDIAILGKGTPQISLAIAQIGRLAIAAGIAQVVCRGAGARRVRGCAAQPAECFLGGNPGRLGPNFWHANDEREEARAGHRPDELRGPRHAGLGNKEVSTRDWPRQCLGRR